MVSRAGRSTKTVQERDISPASGAAGFTLSDVLRAEIEGAGKMPRSEATRQKFLVAAAELIQESGFNDLKVADICKRAGFAHGTFYLHWNDRRAVAHDVLSSFMKAIRLHRPQRQPGQTFFERLIVGTAYYIEVYRRNIGLMRCQGQLADQLEEFAQLGLQSNLALARRIVRAVEREAPSGRMLSETAMLTTALGCIAMVDKLLHDMFVRGLDTGLDAADLAEVISLSWHRALLGRDP